MTNYLVLMRVPLSDPAIYEVCGHTAANSPLQATRTFANDDGVLQEGEYACVPVRNWSVVESALEKPAPRLRQEEVIPEYLQGPGVVAAPDPNQTTIDVDPEVIGEGPPVTA